MEQNAIIGIAVFLVSKIENPGAAMALGEIVDFIASHSSYLEFLCKCPARLAVAIDHRVDTFHSFPEDSQMSWILPHEGLIGNL